MKKRVAENLILLIVLALLASACGKSGCLKTTGPAKTGLRELTSINSIVLYDKIDLVLTQGAVQQVKIESGQYIQDDIETAVVNGVLTIRDNNGCKWSRDLNEKVTVYITAPNLQKVIYHGAGNISSTNTLIADEFTIDSPDGLGSVHLKVESRETNVIIRMNACDITMEGKSVSTTVYCAVAGTIDLSNFVSGNLYIDQRSIRDAFVNVTGLLDAKILYTGNLYYRGNPTKINTLLNSSGRLFQIP